MTLSSKDAKDLLNRQLKVWQFAKKNFEALNCVETKEFDFGKFSVRVQFNPARIQSSAAKVDAMSIAGRNCFLCPQNLPAEQEGIPFGVNYQVLVNPFPIFCQHFTIPSFAHTDQLVLDRFADMLDLTTCIDHCIIFYNGPSCGASAPDHAHFQAGSKGFMPIEKDMATIPLQVIYCNGGMKVCKIEGYLRNGFFASSSNKKQLVYFFESLYAILDIKEGQKEPLLNILAWYDSVVGSYQVAVFPRVKHRPLCYFADGDANMLISPASVDLGGVFITPLEKDFHKITKEDIATIFSEITISNNELDAIASKLTL